MLLGIEAGIPDELYEEFNATATSHVIVISASNVALIAGIIGATAVRVVGRKRAVWPTVAGIARYVLLVGGDAAVLRVAVMGSLVVVATTLDRRSTALVSLAAACALMTVLNPLALWDVGLQLSSGATAGLIYSCRCSQSGRGAASPGCRSTPAGSPPCSPTWKTRCLVTVAANLMTLPLVFHNFGRLSTVSLVTNLLIAPVQALIMLWGSAAVSLGAAGLEPVGRAVLAVPWLALTWTVAMVRWTASWPGASLEIGQFGAPALALSYIGLLGLRWRGQVQRATGAVLGWLRGDLIARLGARRRSPCWQWAPPWSGLSSSPCRTGGCTSGSSTSARGTAFCSRRRMGARCWWTAVQAPNASSTSWGR